MFDLNPMRVKVETDEAMHDGGLVQAQGWCAWVRDARVSDAPKPSANTLRSCRIIAKVHTTLSYDRMGCSSFASTLTQTWT